VPEAVIEALRLGEKCPSHTLHALGWHKTESGEEYLIKQLITRGADY
jgi:hypothetical protein